MKKSVVCLVVAMSMGMTAFISCSGSEKASMTAASDVAGIEVDEASQNEEGVINLADDNKFRPGAEVQETTVLDFNAVWCIPCKKLAPAFELAAKEFKGKAEFYSVDYEKNPETAKAFGVAEVPCVIIIRPDGSYATYPSLSDFISEDQLKDKSLSAEQVTEIIYKSIAEKLSEK